MRPKYVKGWTVDRLAGSLLLLLGAWWWAAGAGKEIPDAWLFPRCVGAAMSLLGVPLLLSRNSDTAEAHGSIALVRPPVLKDLGRFLCIVAFYILTIPVVGFTVSSGAVFAATSALLRPPAGVKDLLWRLFVGGTLAVLVTVLLKDMFYVPLPEGLLWRR